MELGHWTVPGPFPGRTVPWTVPWRFPGPFPELLPGLTASSEETDPHHHPFRLQTGWFHAVNGRAIN